MNTTTAETNVSCGVFTVWIANAHLFHDQSTVLLVALVLLIPPTAILNAVVLYVIWRRPLLQRTSNLFLCNLALSDLAIPVLVLPLVIAWIVGNLTGLRMKDFCEVAVLVGVLGNIFGSLSFLTITAATVDRYLALRLHLRYTAVVTKKRVIYSCMGLWVISSIFSSIMLIDMFAYRVLLNMSFAGCMATTLFCYYKIYRILKYHHTQIQIQMAGQPVYGRPNMNKYKSSVMNLVYVFVLYMVLYAPFVLANIMRQHTKYDLYTSMNTFMIGTFLVYLNSALNPILYCCRKTEIRNAIMETLRLRPRVATTPVERSIKITN